MPHRIGRLWEQMIEDQNMIKAEVVMGKNKPDNRVAQYIKENPEPYAKALKKKILNGYEFHEPYETTIKDSYKGKERALRIPCLEDQAAMQAWLNIATPYIESRNYYYNCGSIPKAGQSRAVNGLKRKLRCRKPPKWAAVTDIKKFYNTCSHEIVLKGLRRIFKDEEFVHFAEKMMDSMYPNGVGLAIGYPVSHWFANVALMEIDLTLARRFPDVLHFRYMDDTVFISRNKRHLRRALQWYMQQILILGMRVKQSWQVFPISARGITFLSYRFFIGYTILCKKLMLRIAKRIRMIAKNLNAHNAMSAVSYMGILKHCNSHHFLLIRVVPYIIPKKCRKVISNASKDAIRLEA